MKRLFAIAMLVSVVSGVFAGVGGAASLDPRVQECSGGPNVQAVFDVPRASALWEHLPAMKMAPELERKDGPASVVVYGGGFEGLILGRTGMERQKIDGAICVLTSDGDRTIYANVSLDGFRRP